MYTTVYISSWNGYGTHLHNTVPSLSASNRSPGGKRSPNTSSIQVRTSLAACGVYLPSRNFFMSWSSEVTDAMAASFRDAIPFSLLFDFGFN